MTEVSKKTISTTAMQKKIRQAVFDNGGPKRSAAKWSNSKWQISASYLRQVITGATKPSKPLCAAIGFEPVKEIKYRYREIK